MDDEVAVPDLPVAEREDVLASEAATYAFCAKAWHLEYAMRKSPSTAAVERRSEGTTRHETHGARVGELRRFGPRLLLWTALLFGLAVVLLVLGLLAGR